MAKYKMSDDFDKEKAALRQEFNDLKTRIDQVTSRTLLITMLANAGSLFLRASELGIDLNISELLVSAESKVKFYENEIAQDRDSQNREEQERLAETLAEAQRVANEAREAELKQHRKDYSAMVEKGFHKRLTEDNDFLEHLTNKPPGSLTEKEEERLTGNYKYPKDKKEAEERAKEKSDGYKLAYQIRKNAKASIKYRENKIAENVQKHASAPDEASKKVLETENEEHTQVIKSHEVALKETQPAIDTRERDRKLLKKLANLYPPESLEWRVREHFELHVEDYKEELEKDPEHKGLHELHAIVRKVGLDKELIIDKHTSQEQTPATTTKDINTPANLVVHDQETKQKKQLSQEVSNPITEPNDINTPANLVIHDQETKQKKQLSQEVSNPITEPNDINTPANLVVHDQDTKQEKQLSQEASNPITEPNDINTPANLVVHDQDTKQEKQLSEEALLQTKELRKALEKTRDAKPVQKFETLPAEKKNITSQRLQRLANKGKGIT